MTFDELRGELCTMGWRIQPTGDMGTGVCWFAWSGAPNLADCALNEKPPVVAITPRHHRAPGYDHQCVDFEIRGVPGTSRSPSVLLQMFSVPIDDAVNTIDTATAILSAAWNAAARAGASP